MKTDRLWVKAMLATLVVLMCAWAVFAQEGPTAEELAQVTATLITAGGQIARGNLETGQTALTAIQEVAQEQLASRWEFVTKLSEAVTAEKSGKLAEAELALRRAAGSATEPDQLTDTFLVGGRLVSALNRADKKTEAVELVTFLSEGGVKQSTDLSLHLRLVSLWTTVGDVAKAESTLTSAAVLPQDEAQWKSWGQAGVSVLTRERSLSAHLAMYKRLAAFAAPVESQIAKELLTSRLLATTRSQTAYARDFEKIGEVSEVFAEVKTLAVGMPAFASRVTLIEKMISAHTLSGQADHAGALAALQEAYALANGDADAGWNIYREGTALVEQRLKAEDVASAKALVNFLKSGPGPAGEPWYYHVDMARFHLEFGDHTTVEEELGQAASAGTERYYWGQWAQVAWSLVDRAEGTEARQAVCGRLLQLSTSAIAKEKLLNRLFYGAQSCFASGSKDKGVAVLDAIRDTAAGMPGMTRQANLVGFMAAALKLSGTGDHAGALSALQAAYELADEDSSEVRDLYRESVYLVKQRLDAGDKDSAAALMAFLYSGPGTKVSPWTLHMGMVSFQMALGDPVKAEDELRQAAPAAASEGDWRSWAGSVRHIFVTSPVEEGIAVVERLAPLATSDVAKEQLAKLLLVDLRGYLRRPNYTQRIAVFETVREVAVGCASLEQEVSAVGQIVSAYRLADRGDKGAALKVLQEAYAQVGEDPGLKGEVYAQAKRIILAGFHEKKDKADVSDLMAFVRTGPGRDIAPFVYHIDMAWFRTSLMELAKAEEELRQAAPLCETTKEWQAWGYRVLQIARQDRSVDPGLEVFARMEPLATSPAAKEAFVLNKVSFLIQRSRAPEAEGLLETLSETLPDGNADPDVVTQMYRLAGLYGRLGRPDDARRVFSEAETCAESLTESKHIACLRSSFYYDARPDRTGARGRRVNKTLPALLAGMIRDGGGEPLPAYRVSEYCRSAAAAGQGAEAVKLLGEIEAMPSAYLLLAEHLRSYGDIRGARRALHAIPRSALKTDVELAKSVTEFWPSPAQKAKADIERCLGLIGVFEERAKEATADGNDSVAQEYQTHVKDLQERIAVLKKEAE